MNRNPVKRGILSGLILLAMIGGLTGNALALNIVLNFNSGNSDNPGYDSTAAQLTAIMQAVEVYWQDIIEDSHTLTINYWWEDLSDASGTLASHLNTGNSGGRETTCNIRFDNYVGGFNRDWYIDSTPTNHSEFDMGQILYRDLTATEKSNWFDGSPPDRLETAFIGDARSSAPAAARNGYDIFSVALHEVGHALGMTSAVASGETGDQDYDVDSDFVYGAGMAIDCYAAGNRYHIADNEALMYPYRGTGQRCLPSATDVFAMAAASNWTNIDLPRKDFWGGTYWNTAINWEGNQLPDTGDDAFVRHGGTVSLSGNGYAGNLFLNANSVIRTQDHYLYVSDTTTIDGGSQIFVDSSGSMDSNHIYVTGAGGLRLIGGVVEVDNFIGIEAGSFLQDYGTLKVRGTLRNDGTILVHGGTITLTDMNTGYFDLDGTSGDGEVKVNAGYDLVVNGPLSDNFDGQMSVRAGSSATFNDGWTLGTSGTLYLRGGTTSTEAAVINSSQTRIMGNIDAIGKNRIASPVTFESSADVSIASNAELELDGLTTFQGGNYTGNGVLQQDGNTSVEADTTIDVATYDWDGTTGNTTTTINSGVTFTINSNQLDLSSPTIDGFDGTANINSGTLAVNTTDAWRMEGTMNLNDSGTNPSVNGSRMIVLDTINVSGTGDINAATEFRSTAVVNIPNSTDLLRLYGDTTYNGGSYTGAGRLFQNANATVAGDTTIDVATFDWDGGSSSSITTINPGTRLIINSDKIDVTDGFDATVTLNSGTLTVNTTDAWRIEGIMNLNNTGGGTPAITGKDMIVSGTINGTGNTTIFPKTTFESTAAVNLPGTGDALSLLGGVKYQGGTYTGSGTIRQTSDATVTADTTIDVGTYDMDGAANNSATSVTSGVTLTLNVDSVEKTTGDGFDGTLNLSSGSLAVNTPSPWTMEGTVNFSNFLTAPAGIISGSKMLVSGTVNALGRSARIDAPVTFLASANVDIPSAGGQLTLNGPITYQGGSYTGDGTLVCNNNADVSANTTIDVNTYDWDGSGSYTTTVQPGVTFTINSYNIDTSGGGFGGKANIQYNATLAVNKPSQWELAPTGTIALKSGKITGSQFSNKGLVQGTGTIQSTGLINDGTLQADLGTLTLDTTAFPDLDGVSNSGTLEATGGDIYIPGNPGGQFTFKGKLTAGNGHNFQMDHYGLYNAGTITLSGGNYVAPKFTQAGNLYVDTNTATLATTAVFGNGSTTTLNADLQINGAATLYAGSAINGTGDLVVTAGSILNGEAILNVDLVNNGLVSPGFSPGTIVIDGNYTQSPGGSLLVELADISTFDQLDISGIAMLDGLLDISILSPFVPSEGDAFDILTYGSYSGQFDSITGDWIIGNGIYINPVYEPTYLRLLTVHAIPGDANYDGLVDVGDLGILAANYGTSGGAVWEIGDFNYDGLVDVGDLGILAANYGSTAAPAGVPEPATLLFLTLASAAAIRRRR